MAKPANDKNQFQLPSDKGPDQWVVSDFKGVSPQAQQVREQLLWIANEKGAKCILITGETGVGKDLTAKILHSTSVNVKNKNNFVHINCGDFDNDHVKSELFGHRKNSYTNGDYERLGCFRTAMDGALFVNEIGNISLDIQSRLLHVLDDHKVKPLGMDIEIEVNPLLIFATNADLDLMCQQGLFRYDLLMRLQCYQLHIPPLRERREDIPLIADMLYRDICLESGKGIKPIIDNEAYKLMAAGDLKGNVRELRNMLIAAYGCMSRNNKVVLLASHFCRSDPKPCTDENDVPLTEQNLRETFVKRLQQYLKQQQLLKNNQPTQDDSCIFYFPDFVGEIEAVFLQDADGNKTRAAKHMGISRKLFYRKKQD